MTAVAGTRVAVDRNLLKFKTHDDYLDSLITPVDMKYLRSSEIARQVASLGYRSTGETVGEQAFHKRSQAVENLLHPPYRPYVLDSESAINRDVLKRELGFRERANRLGNLSTIIYVQQSTMLNREISGYIDYAHRLIAENWKPFFHEERKIRPRKMDLSYYDWRSEKIYLNDTPNYRAMMDEKFGLMFENLHDGKYIFANPYSENPGVDSTRVRIRSDQYEHVVLYDHAVR